METDPVFAEAYRAKRRADQKKSLDKKRQDPEWVARKKQLAQSKNKTKRVNVKKVKLACAKQPVKRVQAVIKQQPTEQTVLPRKIVVLPPPPLVEYVHIPGIPWSGMTLAQLVEKGYAKLDAIAPVAKVVETKDSPLIATN